MSGRRYPPPPALAAWLEARRPLPPHVAYLEGRYASEPYRLALSLVAADLEAASRDDMTARLLDEAPHQARITRGEVKEVLDLIAGAMPPALADEPLRAVRAALDTFRLHAARLDIREDAGRLAAALGGILAALEIDRDFAQGDDRARTARDAQTTPGPRRSRGAGRGTLSRGHRADHQRHRRRPAQHRMTVEALVASREGGTDERHAAARPDS